MTVDATLAARARRTVERLGLQVASVDYVVGGNDAVLFEVNAYPGCFDVPSAVEAFVGLAAERWRRVGA